MNTVVRCALVGLFLVGPGTVAQAGYYYSNGHYYYHEPVYEKKVVEKVIILDYLPPYPVGYAPTYAVPAPAVAPAPHKTACEEKLDSLSAKLAALEAKVSAAAPPAELPVPKKAAAPSAKGDGLAVLQSKCASCHTGATAKKNGDGQPVVLFAEPGKLSPDADPVAMLIAIEDDHMPPGKPLSPEEKKAVREFIRTATAKR